MRNYLTAIRPVNLLLVLATQIIIYLVFFKSLSSLDIDLYLWPYKIWLFIFVTISITASGYLINDYFDFETDTINEKRKHTLNQFQLLLSYYALLFIGLGISVWLAIDFGRLEYALIYIFAQGLLFWYAAQLKSTVLIGNILVSLFTVGVIWIFRIAEWDAILRYREIRSFAPIVYDANFKSFASFVFLLNLIREIIKDVEDLEGDKLAGLQSLAIVKGAEFSLKLAMILSLLLLIVIVYWGFHMHDFNHIGFVDIYFLLAIVLPVLFLCIKLGRRLHQQSIRQLQLYVKAIMLSGLIFIVLWAWI